LPLYSEWNAPLFPPDYRLKPIGFGQGTAYADLARFVDTNPPPVLSDFQSPLILRWLAPRFFRLSQTHYRAWAVWHQSAGVAAAFDIMAQMGGTTAKMLLHPQYETLAPLVLQTLIAEAEQAQSGTIISLSLLQHQYYDAALQAGFSSDFRYVRM